MIETCCDGIEKNKIEVKTPKKKKNIFNNETCFPDKVTKEDQ